MRHHPEEVGRGWCTFHKKMFLSETVFANIVNKNKISNKITNKLIAKSARIFQ